MYCWIAYHTTPLSLRQNKSDKRAQQPKQQTSTDREMLIIIRVSQQHKPNLASQLFTSLGSMGPHNNINLIF